MLLASIKIFAFLKSTATKNDGSLAGLGITFVLILFAFTIILCHQGLLIHKENKVRRHTYLCLKSIEKLYKDTDKKIDLLNKTILVAKPFLLTPMVKVARVTIKVSKLSQNAILYYFLSKNFFLEGCDLKFSIRGLLKFPYKTLKKLTLKRENDLAIKRSKKWTTKIFTNSTLIKRAFKLNVKIEYVEGDLIFSHEEEKLLSSVLSGLPSSLVSLYGSSK
tara:strand:- start:58624 stop:59283 length:660 start_codon:yes stop_codon:yes gene_type:complete